MSTRELPREYIYACDYCLIEHKTFSGGLPPAWWTCSNPSGSYIGPFHFCTKLCLVSWLTTDSSVRGDA